MEVLGLYQLNHLVKQAMKECFSDTLLVVAEIADIKENRSGHCYLELVEKKEDEETVIATVRATIWAFTYRMLKPYFETTTGKCLQKGMKVLVRVEVVFHELYGYSLNIRDIDPTFTIGDLERKRKEILNRLEEEGVINMNRELELSPIPKVIAVISSPTAAGYGDFIDQLHGNPYGYVFHTKLFPAVMQGENTTESVVAALERIYKYESLFDVVVIIRGGGSQTDLGSFDSYDLAVNVAQFPLPVIAGIGHERDDTIVDRVAYRKVKTPTAAAAFLIERFQEVDAFLGKMRDGLSGGVNKELQAEKTRQLMLLTGFKQYTRAFLEEKRTRMVLQSQKINNVSKLFMRSRQSFFEQVQAKLSGKAMLLLERRQNAVENSKKIIFQKISKVLLDNRYLLDLSETKIRFVDPRNVLKRGFSITRINGKAIRDIAIVKGGDRVETELWNGKLVSEIKVIEPENKI